MLPKKALHWLKLCLPNHPPLLADNGEGCTADKTLCFGFFTKAVNFLAKDPQSKKTIG